MRGSETFRQFFIKLHRASRLHYDFRLENAGVLKSWVLPDGPCLDPTHPQEAVPVADHQVKYGSLERVIPSGQYGAGPMLLWDHGMWLPCHNVDQGLRDGRLLFHLDGSKLKGVWSLERRPARFGVRGERWQLKKEEDAEAWPLSERNIIAEMPTSVLTGRTLDEVAADPSRVVPSRSDSQGSARSRKNSPHRSQPLLPFGEPAS